MGMASGPTRCISLNANSGRGRQEAGHGFRPMSQGHFFRPVADDTARTRSSIERTVVKPRGSAGSDRGWRALASGVSRRSKGICDRQHPLYLELRHEISPQSVGSFDVRRIPGGSVAAVRGPWPAAGLTRSGLRHGGRGDPPAILGPTDDTASGVAIQRQGDGKIVVAGTARGVEGPSAFAVARYNADGSLDAGFGNGGTALHALPLRIGPGLGRGDPVRRQGRGGGDLPGHVNGSSVEEFALARYTKDGILDKSFGIGGEVITDFGTDSFSSASSVAITPGGQIVVSGPVTISGVNDFGVARYNSNGKLDKSFGIGGEATASFPNLTVFLTAVDLALQPDGKVVLAGTVADFSSGFKAEFGLARFGTNGRLDATFGTGGEVVTSFGATNVSSVAGVALEPGTNAIVVAGTVQDPSTFAGEFALARYKASNGSLDATFGNGRRGRHPIRIRHHHHGRGGRHPGRRQDRRGGGDLGLRRRAAISSRISPWRATPSPASSTRRSAPAARSSPTSAPGRGPRGRASRSSPTARSSGRDRSHSRSAAGPSRGSAWPDTRPAVASTGVSASKAR